MTSSNLLVRVAPVLLATAFAASAADAQPTPPRKRTVGIVIYDGAEPLDFAGPYEVFSLAHTHDAPPAEAEPGMMGPMRRVFDVRVVAATTRPVTLAGGLKVVPTDTFDACPQVDVLVVPGGGHGGVVADRPLVAWVARQAKGAELVTSVCTGSFVLGEAGLLDGRQSATNHLSVSDMQAKYPRTTVLAGRRVVQDGNVVTAAGVSSGLDMALYVVGKLYGDGVAGMAADIIEYPYPAAAVPTPAAGHAVRGRVVAVTGGSVTLDHEDIPGLMDAMRMTFTLQDSADADVIKAGDVLGFDLVRRPGGGYAMTHVKRLPPTTPLKTATTQTSK